MHMKINKNAKKLVTMSKMAIKGLKPSKTLAWFFIEGKSDEYYFCIDPKNRVAQKYKDAKIVKKLLERYKVEGAAHVKDKAPLLAGSIALNDDALELIVSVKRNGAGSSLFTKVLKDSTFKKIVPNASLVKALSQAQIEEPEKKDEKKTAKESREEEVARLVEERRKEEALEKEAEALNLDEHEKKALKLHRWSQEVSRLWSSTPATEENEEFFHTSLRRLNKFQKKKLYTLFDSVHWSKKAFGRRHPLVVEGPNLLLTKAQLPKWIQTCQQKLDAIELEQSWTEVEAEVAALFDEQTVGLFDDFSDYLEEQGVGDDDIADIISAYGVGNKDEFDELLKVCGGKHSNVRLLCSELAGGNWVYLRSLLAQIES